MEVTEPPCKPLVRFILPGPKVSMVNGMIRSRTTKLKPCASYATRSSGLVSHVASGGLSVSIWQSCVGIWKTVERWEKVTQGLEKEDVRRLENKTSDRRASSQLNASSAKAKQGIELLENRRKGPEQRDMASWPVEMDPDWGNGELKLKCRAVTHESSQRKFSATFRNDTIHFTEPRANIDDNGRLPMWFLVS